MTIAQTTLTQLGGSNKLQAMIGASKFTHDKNGALQFHFKSCKVANIIKIELNGMDLYDITFFKYNNRSLDCKEVEKIINLFTSDLKKVIENFTGLQLSL